LGKAVTDWDKVEPPPPPAGVSDWAKVAPPPEDSDNVGVTRLPPPPDMKSSGLKKGAYTLGGLELANAAKDQDPKKAIQALSDARANNLEPQHAADNADIFQAQRQTAGVAQALAQSPALMSYAGQSTQHVAAIAGDSTNLAAVGRGAFGEPELPWYGDLDENAPPAEDGPAYERPTGPDAITAALTKHTASMIKDFVDAYIGLQSTPSQGVKNLSKSLGSIAGQDLADVIPAPVEAVAGVLPSLVGLGVAAATGPEALFASMFMGGYGRLRAAGVEDGLAATGAALAAKLGSGFGTEFLTGLAPKATQALVRDTAAQAMTSLVRSAAAKEAAKKFGVHAASGALMTISMGMTELITKNIDTYSKTGKEPDPSELWQNFKQLSKQSLALLPFAATGPLMEYHQQMGRHLAAHADQIKLAALTGPLGETAIVRTAPAEAKQIVRQMADDAGERWANEEQPPPSAPARGGSVEIMAGSYVQAAKQSKVVDALKKEINKIETSGDTVPEDLERKLTQEVGKLNRLMEPEHFGEPIPAPARAAGKVYVDADVLRKVATNNKLDPHKVAEQVTGNANALNEAEATNTAIAVPVENYAVDLQPLHKDLAKGTSLHEDNPSLASVQSEPPIDLQEALANLAKPLNNAELTRLAAVNAKAAPAPVADPALNTPQTIHGIQKTFAALKTLGFDVPELPASIVPLNTGEPLSPPKKEPTTPAAIYKAQAVKAMADKTIFQLATKAYASAARKAQGIIDKMRVQTENKLSSAEQTAQQGIDAKTRQEAQDKSVTATQKTVVAGEKSLEAMRQIEIRNLNRAMETARAQAQKAATKVVGSVTASVSDGIRADRYGAGALYGELYDHVSQALGLRTPAPNEELNDPTVSMNVLQTSYGSDLPFDLEQVLALIKTPKELGEMKLSEANTVDAFFKTLQKISSEASKAYTEGQLLDRKAVIDKDILPALKAQTPDGQANSPPDVQNPELARPPPDVRNPKQAGARSRWEAFKDGIAAMKGDESKLSFQTLLKPMGKWGASHFLRVLSAEKVEARIRTQQADAMSLTSKLAGLDRRVPWPQGMSQPGLTQDVSVADMLHIRRLMGTEENSAAIAEATKVPLPAWEAWFDQHMTKDMYDATQQFWTGTKSLGNEQAANMAIRGAVPMVRQTPRKIKTQFGDYTGSFSGPMRWLDGSGRLPSPVSADDPMRGNRVAPDVPHRKTEAPSPAIDRFPDLSASNGQAHFREQARDIAYSEPVRDGHAMFTDPDFQRAVVQRLGQAWYDRLIQAHDRVADGGRVAIDRGISTVNVLFTGGRIVAGATFPFNISTMLKTAIHPLQDAMLQGGGLNLIKGTLRAVSSEGRAESNAQSRIVSLYTRDAYRRQRDMAHDLEGNTDSALEKVGDVASAAGHFFNAHTLAAHAHIIWHTNRYAAPAGSTYQESIDYADQRTAAALPPNTVVRQSAQNMNQLFAAMNLTYNFQGAFFNMKAQNEMEVRANIAGGANKFVARGIQLAQRLGTYATLGLGLWIGGQGRTKQEEEEDAAGHGSVSGFGDTTMLGHHVGTAKWIARTLMVEKYLGSPIAHKLMEMAAPILVGDKPARSYGLLNPPAQELADAEWKDFVTIVNSEKEGSQRLNAAFDSVAMVFVPGHVQMKRSGQASYQLLHAEDFEGDYQPRGDLDRLDMLIRGTKPRNASFLSDAQGLISGRSRQ